MSEKKISFGRIFWPSLWAALIVSIVGLLIWFLIISSFISSGTSAKIEKNSVLHMTLTGAIAENSTTAFDPAIIGVNRTLGLSDIINGFEAAKKDDRVKGILLELNGTQCGYATARAIRNTINKFEESGKFIIAYNSGEVIPLRQFYIASAANESYGYPSSNMEFLGLGAEMSFFKNTLDKMDVEMQIFRGKDNDFKSAVEPLFLDKMSDSSRVQVERFLASIWGDIKTDIATDRSLKPSRLEELAENALVRTVEDAVTHKLIDGVKYKDEILDLVAKKAGTKKDDELALTEFAKYSRKKFYQSQTLNREDDPNIAVIVAEGAVMRSGDGLSSEKICELFREARANETIKSVVFRVNSPGGSALASDEIWREVNLTNETKKVIVSMGDLAASGGYYISAPAEYIFAEPTTITGSIGVFGMIPYTGDMMRENLGLTFDRAATNKHSIMTTNQRLDETETAIIQEMVDDIYLDFKTVVSEGRGLTLDQVQQIARGRVWTGRDALDIGLVDELGGLNDAIAYAANTAKIKNPTVLYYPEIMEDKFGEILEQLEEQQGLEAHTEGGIPQLPKVLTKHYNDLLTLESMTGIQMRLPFFMELD